MNSKAPDLVKERPILFSGPMVNAILEGKKTQTRRIVKPQPGKLELPPDKPNALNCSYAAFVWNERERPPENIHIHCPFGSPGDRLWVRETFRLFNFEPHQHDDMGECEIDYRATPNKTLEAIADEAFTEFGQKSPWKPSIFMPRWASRIDLEITGVRVERLNDISEKDAEAEGAPMAHYLVDDQPTGSYDEGFAQLWESINGEGSWAENPWVWVVEFKRVQLPIN